MSDERTPPDGPPEEAPDPADGPAWRRFADATSAELRDSLGVERYARLDDADRERLVRRLRLAIDRALEVPDDLPARIQSRVERLTADAPDDDVLALAWRRTRWRARRTAAIGTATTIPAMVPIAGPALAALGLVTDWRLVAEQQRDLVLEIAALFGAMPDDPTAEVRGLFLASAGSALVGTQIGEAVTRAAAAQVARRSLSRLLPGVGAAVAGALNYGATIALGRAAIVRFARDAHVEVRGVLPRRVHPAMPRLRERVRQEFVAGSDESTPASAARMPAPSPLADEIEALAELAPTEREELLDTALATALADGIMPAEEARLSAVGAVLGFTPEEVTAARQAFERDVEGYRRRFGRLVSRLGGATRSGARRAWRRAARIARRGIRRRR